MNWLRGQVQDTVRELRRRSTGKTQLEDVGALTDNLYERDVLIAAKLMSTSPFFGQRIIAIKDLGHMSWSGGPAIGKFAGNYLVNLMAFISDTSLPLRMRVASVDAVANICSSSKEAKERTCFLGMVEVLGEVMKDDSPDNSLLRLGAVTALLVIVSENRENQRSALNIPDLQDMLYRIQEENWDAFPDNQAERLITFLGFDRMQ